MLREKSLFCIHNVKLSIQLDERHSTDPPWRWTTFHRSISSFSGCCSDFRWDFNTQNRLAKAELSTYPIMQQLETYYQPTPHKFCHFSACCHGSTRLCRGVVYGKISGLYVHCVEKVPHSKSMPCIEIFTLLVQVSFPVKLSERPAVLLLHSEENMSKISGLASPVLINVTSCCIHTVSFHF